MKSTIITTVFALVVCWAAAGHAQSLYTGYDNSGAAVASGEKMGPVGSGYMSSAHYKLSDTSTTDSNAVNVERCNLLFVKHYCDETAVAPHLASIAIQSHPDAAKSNSFRINPDMDGNGIVNSNDSLIYMTCDAGGDEDGTAPGRQDGKVYDISGDNFVSIDVIVAAGAGKEAFIEVTCR
jgi:hypothetical protein